MASAPLDSPALDAVGRAVEATGQWAWTVDRRWRIARVTRSLRESMGGGGGELADVAVGEHFFGPENQRLAFTWRFGPNSPAAMATVLEGLGGWLLCDAGDAASLRRDLAGCLQHVVDRLVPGDPAALSFVARGMGIGHSVDLPMLGMRIREEDGRTAGTLVTFKPAATMAVLGAMASMADTGHFERVRVVSKAGRRPAAILFADLEGSTALARRMSTAGYFSLGRGLVRAADESVIEAGGIVGRHAGDGVVAFFPAQTAGSESAAAAACIAAARSLRARVPGIAEHHGLAPGDLVLRFGLHWGSTLYMGAISTGGRAEVTALGDEVNVAARIEACATGGLVLASRDLLERLDPAAAGAAGLEPATLRYTTLGELPTAVARARRDAPDVPVFPI